MSAQGLQARGGLAVVLVGTADLITQGHQHFGDAAHADAADADEMHARECPGQVTFCKQMPFHDAIS